MNSFNEAYLKILNEHKNYFGNELQSISEGFIIYE